MSTGAGILDTEMGVSSGGAVYTPPEQQYRASQKTKACGRYKQLVARPHILFLECPFDKAAVAVKGDALGMAI